MGFETVFFAIVAFLVLGRLFQVLGQNHGAPPPIMKDFGAENNGEQNAPINRGAENIIDKQSQSSNSDGLEGRVFWGPVEERYSGLSEEIKKIRAHEITFNPSQFEKTAALAFEAIVTAFGKGDLETLRNLTVEKVLIAYKEGIKQRQNENKGAIDIVKLGDPEIRSIEITNKNNREVAAIDVEIAATLTSTGEKTRNTKEIWTFEKILGDKDPIWRLSAVHSV